MASTQLICRIRVKKAEEKDVDTTRPHDSAVLQLRDCPDVGIETRTAWAREIMKHFGKLHDRIRPWDFLVRLNGSVESLALPSSKGEVYPARFQIPPDTLRGLDHNQKVKRAEMFAMASLLYEIMSGREPFEDLTDDEVQRRFRSGDFPDDAASLPTSLFICSGWSEEFSQELTRRAQDASISQRLGNYAKAHPVLTGIQAVGLTLSAVSFLAVPVLGFVGFGAAGPAAGSIAAAWQASIGSVQAGSLFAWCQNAAMGGAALNSVQVAGLAGAALTRVSDVPGLVEAFKSRFRTNGPQGERLL